MKTIKNIIVAIACIIIGFLLCLFIFHGSVYAKGGERFKKIYSQGTLHPLTIIEDSKTGVLYFEDYYGEGLAISVMYDSNGNILTEGNK